MRFTTSLVAIGSIASLAAAVATPDFDLDAILLEKRQSGDPSYDCHYNCGNTIKDSRTDGYCTSEKWLGMFKACLNCALKYDNIWEGYGPKVSAAAKACGLDATPVDPNGGGDSTTQAPQPQTSTSSGEKPSSDKPSPEPTTSAGEGGKPPAHTGDHTSAVSTPGAVVTDKPAHTTPAPGHTGGQTGGHGNSTASAAPTVPTGAAAGIQQPIALAMGAVALFAANLM